MVVDAFILSEPASGVVNVVVNLDILACVVFIVMFPLPSKLAFPLTAP